MKAGVVILVALIAVAAYTGCKKKDTPVSSDAGKGGTATLTVTPEHHGDLVDTCTVYIRYNTQDAPSDGVYDDSAVCALVDTTPVATFIGLKEGNYYLFAKGFHSLYVPPYIKGGLNYTISSQGSTLSVIIPTYSYQL